MSATIEIATESTDELVQAMAVLIPQLSKSNPPRFQTQAVMQQLLVQGSWRTYLLRHGVPNRELLSGTPLSHRESTSLRDTSVQYGAEGRSELLDRAEDCVQ